LRKFAGAAISAAAEDSGAIGSLADTVAAHAHYLAALSAVFSDQLRQEEVERACDKTRPLEVRFDTLARARRYLGVNDAFARILIPSFFKARI